MSYMAVGSRQILFSDSIAPSSARDAQAQVASVVDNQDVSVTEPQATGGVRPPNAAPENVTPGPAPTPPADGVGENVNVLA